MPTWLADWPGRARPGPHASPRLVARLESRSPYAKAANEIVLAPAIKSPILAAHFQATFAGETRASRKTPTIRLPAQGGGASLFIYCLFTIDRVCAQSSN